MTLAHNRMLLTGVFRHFSRTGPTNFWESPHFDKSFTPVLDNAGAIGFSTSRIKSNQIFIRITNTVQNATKPLNLMEYYRDTHTGASVHSRK